MQRFALALAVSLACGLFGGEPVSAQGLIWNLPEGNTRVRYEGDFEQTVFRPNSNEGDLTINWIRHLTIKSLGSEMAEYNGESTRSRWLEFKVVTGKPSEAGIDPGPIGSRLYKVLVPENRVIGQVRDAQGIFVSFLPIVKGYRQIGDRPVEPLEQSALQVYPTISLLTHYEQLEADPAAGEVVQTPYDTLNAKKFTAQREMENFTNRSRNRAEIWRSDEVPFGLAQWQVEVLRETKDKAAPREEFAPATRVRVTMSVHEIDSDARSELVEPGQESSP